MSEQAAESVTSLDDVRQSAAVVDFMEVMDTFGGRRDEWQQIRELLEPALKVARPFPAFCAKLVEHAAPVSSAWCLTTGGVTWQLISWDHNQPAVVLKSDHRRQVVPSKELLGGQWRRIA
ncbi:MAG: hypothetical protein H6739_07735 [Alphaproteobacteria bacterium]|nr:hypothetical protein [Alphaproteobacteria bacterium]